MGHHSHYQDTTYEEGAKAVRNNVNAVGLVSHGGTSGYTGLHQWNLDSHQHCQRAQSALHPDDGLDRHRNDRVGWIGRQRRFEHRRRI